MSVSLLSLSLLSLLSFLSDFCVGSEIPPWRRAGLGSFYHHDSLSTSRSLRILSAAQNASLSPAECVGITPNNNNRAVKLSLWWSGLGATLNRLAREFCTHHSRGSVVWMKEELGEYITSWPNGWRWFYDETFCPKPVTLHCFLLPLSTSCSKPLPPSPPPPPPPSFTSNRPPLPRLGAKDCQRVFLPFFLRPSSRLQHYLHEEYDKYWAKLHNLTRHSRRNMISLHIRWGDKVIDTDLLPISAYMDKVVHAVVEHNIASPIILLSSEDQYAIDMFQEAAAHNTTLTQRNASILVYNYSRPYYQCGKMNKTELSSLRHARVGKAVPYGCNHLSMTTGSDSMILVSLLNLFISAEAPILICMHASNWCGLMEQMRVFFNQPGTIGYLL
jgi:hypothetical protein